MRQTIQHHMPHLSQSQSKGLALWVCGTILAGSGCQSAVGVSLWFVAGFNTMRQYLREWFHDGADRSNPCQTQLDVSRCFAPLMRWIVYLWKSDTLALAIDPTMKGDRINALVMSSVLVWTSVLDRDGVQSAEIGRLQVRQDQAGRP